MLSSDADGIKLFSEIRELRALERIPVVGTLVGPGDVDAAVPFEGHAKNWGDVPSKRAGQSQRLAEAEHQDRNAARRRNCPPRAACGCPE